MRRSMSRTLPIVRHRRSITPVCVSHGASAVGSPLPVCHEAQGRSISPAHAFGPRVLQIPSSHKSILQHHRRLKTVLCVNYCHYVHRVMQRGHDHVNVAPRYSQMHLSRAVQVRIR